jgi:hypothetical protein
LLFSRTANSQQNDQEFAETYVLRTGDNVETTFRVLADRIGIVPADERPFDEVVDALKNSDGIEVIRSNKDENIIIVRTLTPKHTYFDLQEAASILTESNASLIRWASPIVIADSNQSDTSNIRNILLPTNVVIAKVRNDITDETVNALAPRLNLTIVRRNPVDDREYYFMSSVKKREDLNVFKASQAFLDSNLFEYAVPNFLIFVELRQSIVNDELFGRQWPLSNTGQNNGKVDADIDADLTWASFGLGKAGTIIAVIDGGFDMAHLDLIPNFYVNQAEDAKNHIDDDGNGYVDDRSGWDFTSDCWGDPVPGCGDRDPSGGDTPEGRHGTMTSGAAAAAGDNARGVSGSCPNCQLLPLRIRTLWGSVLEQSLAFAYAQEAGADIITNSWGYRLRGLVTQPIENAINNANAAGSAIFFAMSTTGEGYENDCVGAPPFSLDISSLDSVIAVSASNNVDTRTPAGYGNCMAVLAPTDNERSGAGTLWPVSTDVTAAAGYNSNNPIAACASTEFAPPPEDRLSYTFCANGTSYAAPLTAGIAGLMKSVDGNLTPSRQKEVLQDTADKIEPAVAAYGPNTGFSSPTVAPTPQRPDSPGGVGSTHGFGRVNAYEAVRLVAPIAAGGRGDIDVFLRDNSLDWGNTEQPSNVSMDNPGQLISYDESVSIKIDAPDYEAAPPTTALEFAAFPDEDPRAGVTNKIYVLVRNRGRNPAANVAVKLLGAFPSATFPELPKDFWNVFPADSATSSLWTVIGTQTIPSVGYSGASIAKQQAGDGAQVATFDFEGPMLDASSGASRDYYLFAVVGCIDDPVSDAAQASFQPEVVTPIDNNITLRKVSLKTPSS